MCVSVRLCLSVSLVHVQVRTSSRSVEEHIASENGLRRDGLEPRGALFLPYTHLLRVVVVVLCVCMVVVVRVWMLLRRMVEIVL